MKYGIEVYAPVDDHGLFTDEVEFFSGKFVFAANKDVIAKLKEVGALMASETMGHSYPHCWRCKKPVIFRARTNGSFPWKRGSPAKCAQGYRTVQWITKWGRDRIYGMIRASP